jgi:hypothetical protein
MKKCISILLLILVNLGLPINSIAQEESEVEKLQVGVYIEDVYNIDYTSSTYEVVFFIWVNSKKELFEIEQYIDIIGSTELSYSMVYEDTLSNGYYHSERKVTAKILNKFDVNHFPFDKANLILKLEFVKEDAAHCAIEFDRKESRLTPDYVGADRNEFRDTFELNKKYYFSNYGNHDLGVNTNYPELVIKLDLQRDQWNIFAKLFITLFIAFILASSSILLPLEMSEEKFGLIVGSLFTSIGNKYITDELLPMSSNFNLSDRIHMLTFIFITLMAIFAVVEQRYKIQMSRRSDFMIFTGSFLLYFIFVGFACLLSFE